MNNGLRALLDRYDALLEDLEEVEPATPDCRRLSEALRQVEAVLLERVPEHSADALRWLAVAVAALARDAEKLAELADRMSGVVARLERERERETA